MGFVIENTYKELINLNESLRYKLKKVFQPTVFNFITQELFLEMLNSNAEPDFKKLLITDVLWEKFFKKYDYVEVAKKPNTFSGNLFNLLILVE